jgi:hypothetical protein
MIDIWQNGAAAGVHLSHMLPAGGQGRRRSALAGAGSMHLAHAFALGPFGMPDTSPLIGELEPGKFRCVDRLEGRSLERTVGRRAALTIGWRRLCLGRLRLLRALLPRTAAQRDGRSDEHGEEHPGLSAPGDDAGNWSKMRHVAFRGNRPPSARNPQANGAWPPSQTSTE